MGVFWGFFFFAKYHTSRRCTTNRNKRWSCGVLEDVQANTHFSNGCALTTYTDAINRIHFCRMHHPLQLLSRIIISASPKAKFHPPPNPGASFTFQKKTKTLLTWSLLTCPFKDARSFCNSSLSNRSGRGPPRAGQRLPRAHQNYTSHLPVVREFGHQPLKGMPGMVVRLKASSGIG